MIYLIGGPPKCGKTTLAKILSKSLGITWISADTIQSIIQSYTAIENYSELFPHSVARKNKNNDIFYTEYDSKIIVDRYIKQGKATDKAIEVISEQYLLDNDDIIVEGYQITPELVDKIIKKYDIKNIKTIFLVKEDKDIFVKNIHKSTTINDWIIKKTQDEKIFPKIAKMISLYSDYFKIESQKHAFKVINMDNDFENKIKEAIDYLTTT